MNNTTTQPAVGSYQYDLANGLAAGTSSSYAPPTPKDTGTWAAAVPPTSITPQPYRVPSSTTIPSSNLGPNTSMDSLLSLHNDKLNSLATDPTKIPSDGLMANLANNIYQSSLYTPEEIAGMNRLQDIKTKSLATTLAQRRQINSLYENGAISKDQATTFGSESQRRSDQQLADQALQELAQTNTLGVLGQIRGNQLTGLQNLATLLKPQEVTPGSTLYNQVTGPNYQAPLTALQQVSPGSALVTPQGQTVYQGNGGSPQAILGYAQNLISNDQAQGTIQLLPDGSINQAYYQQLAQQAYANPGAMASPYSQAAAAYAPTAAGTGNPAITGTPQNQLQQIATSLVTGDLAPSKIPAGLNQATVLGAANQISLATKGVPFNATEAEANYGATQAALTQNATTFRAVTKAQQTAIEHLDMLLDYSKELSKGITGLGSFPLLNTGNLTYLRNKGNETVGQYDSALSIARGEISKVLSGGTPTDQTNKEAEKTLPDNLGYSQLQKKIETIKSLMASKVKEYSDTTNVPQYGKGASAQSGAVVQTKAGPINVNW